MLPLFLGEYARALPNKKEPLCSTGPKWNPETRFRAAASNHRSLAQIDLFAPLAQDDTSLVFLDLRFWRDTKSNTEGNYGLAYRKLNPSLGWIFGGYGFFDNRLTEHNNVFQQGTFGVEALSELWDFRLNAYAPLSKAKKILHPSSKPEKIVFRGHEEYFTSHKEISLRGFDTEIGRLVPGTETVRFYVGGYHFQGSGTHKINGVRTRLTWSINDHIDVEADYQYDNVRHSAPFFWLTLRIPFGEATLKKLTPLERRMQEVIVRDIDIVTQKKKVPAPTGRKFIFASLNGQGDGTFESPMDSNNQEVVLALLKSNPQYLYYDLSSGKIMKAKEKIDQVQKTLKLEVPEAPQPPHRVPQQTPAVPPAPIATQQPAPIIETVPQPELVTEVIPEAVVVPQQPGPVVEAHQPESIVEAPQPEPIIESPQSDSIVEALQGESIVEALQGESVVEAPQPEAVREVMTESIIDIQPEPAIEVPVLETQHTPVVDVPVLQIPQEPAAVTPTLQATSEAIPQQQEAETLRQREVERLRELEAVRLEQERQEEARRSRAAEDARQERERQQEELRQQQKAETLRQREVERLRELEEDRLEQERQEEARRSRAAEDAHRERERQQEVQQPERIVEVVPEPIVEIHPEPIVEAGPEPVEEVLQPEGVAAVRSERFQQTTEQEQLEKERLEQESLQIKKLEFENRIKAIVETKQLQQEEKDRRQKEILRRQQEVDRLRTLEESPLEQARLEQQARLENERHEQIHLEHVQRRKNSEDRRKMEAEAEPLKLEAFRHELSNHSSFKETVNDILGPILFQKDPGLIKQQEDKRASHERLQENEAQRQLDFLLKQEKELYQQKNERSSALVRLNRTEETRQVNFLFQKDAELRRQEANHHSTHENFKEEETQRQAHVQFQRAQELDQQHEDRLAAHSRFNEEETRRQTHIQFLKDEEFRQQQGERHIAHIRFKKEEEVRLEQTRLPQVEEEYTDTAIVPWLSYASGEHIEVPELLIANHQKESKTLLNLYDAPISEDALNKTEIGEYQEVIHFNIKQLPLAQDQLSLMEKLKSNLTVDVSHLNSPEDIETVKVILAKYYPHAKVYEEDKGIDTTGIIFEDMGESPAKLKNEVIDEGLDTENIDFEDMGQSPTKLKKEVIDEGLDTENIDFEDMGESPTKLKKEVIDEGLDTENIDFEDMGESPTKLKNEVIDEGLDTENIDFEDMGQSPTKLKKEVIDEGLDTENIDFEDMGESPTKRRNEVIDEGLDTTGIIFEDMGESPPKKSTNKPKLRIIPFNLYGRNRGNSKAPAKKIKGSPQSHLRDKTNVIK